MARNSDLEEHAFAPAVVAIVPMHQQPAGVGRGGPGEEDAPYKDGTRQSEPDQRVRGLRRRLWCSEEKRRAGAAASSSGARRRSGRVVKAESLAACTLAFRNRSWHSAVLIQLRGSRSGCSHSGPRWCSSVLSEAALCYLLDADNHAEGLDAPSSVPTSSGCYMLAIGPTPCQHTPGLVL